MSYIGKNWKEWPEFHPRRADHGKPRRDGSINVADPNNEQFTLAEWEEFSKGSTSTTSRLAVTSSDMGAGRLDIVKTEYKNGTYHIFPTFYPNSRTEEEVKIGKGYSVAGDNWPFENGKAAMQAARDAYNIVFKIDQRKGA